MLDKRPIVYVATAISSKFLKPANRSGESFITFSLTHKSPTSWAPANFEVAWAQFPITSKSISKPKTLNTKPVEFVTAEGEIVLPYGAILLDPNKDQFWKDRRFISDDRLHMNAEGHYRAAQGVLFTLGKTVDENWRTPLPPEKADLLPIRIFKNFKWFITFGIPWMSRRIRGRSSGDGRSPKYPTPTKWPI